MKTETTKILRAMAQAIAPELKILQDQITELQERIHAPDVQKAIRKPRASEWQQRTYKAEQWALHNGRFWIAIRDTGSEPGTTTAWRSL